MNAGCIYTYNGKEYSEHEFKHLLLSGELDSFLPDDIEMPAAEKPVKTEELPQVPSAKSKIQKFKEKHLSQSKNENNAIEKGEIAEIEMFPKEQVDAAALSEREKYGLEPLKPTYRGTSLSEWESVLNGGFFESKEGFGDNPNKLTWVSDKKEYSDDYVKSSDNGVLVEFKPEAIDKSSVESGQQNDDTGVRLGRGLKLEDVQMVTDKDGNIIYEAPAEQPQEKAQPVKSKALSKFKEKHLSKKAAQGSNTLSGVENTTKMLDDIEKNNPSKINELVKIEGFNPSELDTNEKISKEYHEAKSLSEDVRLPEQKKLIKAVESIIEPQPLQPQPSKSKLNKFKEKHLSQKKQDNATKEGEIPENNQQQHTGAEESRIPAEAVSSNSTEQGGEIEKVKPTYPDGKTYLAKTVEEIYNTPNAHLSEMLQATEQGYGDAYDKINELDKRIQDLYKESKGVSKSEKKVIQTRIEELHNEMKQIETEVNDSQMQFLDDLGNKIVERAKELGYKLNKEEKASLLEYTIPYLTEGRMMENVYNDKTVQQLTDDLINEYLAEEENKEAPAVPEQPVSEKIIKLKEERQQKINEVTKPEFSFETGLTVNELADTTEENRQKNTDFKSQLAAIKKIADCLWT